MNQQEIQAILEPQENIIWQGVVNRKVLIFNLLISLIVLIGISAFILIQTDIGTLWGSIIIAVVVFFSLLSFFSNLVKIYCITNKRVLIKSGLIGTDFNSIYFTQVRTVNVSVGLIDKIFKVGTINIDTGKIETVQTGSGNNRSTRTQTAYDKLLHVNTPYDVYKYFQTTLTGREESLYSGRADKESVQKSI